MKNQTINEMFVNSIFGKSSNEIIAYFKNGSSAKYTISILDLLKSDPSIDVVIDAETGEIL